MARKTSGNAILSHRGRPVNMAALKAANGKVMAAGNARVNARGDILDKTGKVVKTKEQVAAEYYSKNPKAVPTASAALNQPTADMLKTKAPTTPKPENFVDKMAKKNDLESLKKFDLGAVHVEDTPPAEAPKEQETK